MKYLDKYRCIVGDKIIDTIHDQAYPLTTKHIVHINSTYYGGGVAEILNSLVFLMNDIGIHTGWRLLKAIPDFFSITKKFHNALQGDDINLSQRKKDLYVRTNRDNSFFTHLQDHDCVIIHDPQPLPLIEFYKKNIPWIWRCHIDLSRPNAELFNYLKKFIVKYDAMVISTEKFRHDFPITQHIIAPSIDPLSVKNKPLEESIRHRVLAKHGIPLDKPIISQISRFDKWKDPLGVINVFKEVRKKFNCRLVLMGNMAPDDPEGPELYEQVRRQAEKEKDVFIIANPSDNDRAVNALQTESSVVLQKSIREGFALTVSEALWKGTPVVGSNVGGIPLQIIDGKNGFLVNSDKECAARVLKILKNPKMAEKMGACAKDVVRDKFLITRHLLDYVNLLKAYLK